ncbi:MAG TPA: D-alanine--D-alanine ligase family protein [Xanthobacteraceae bacterium]|jgi:D-alanine-D-alanine ligase|nr:D-alanine--D-alanine ligase family protein [Xanthobacteraceae bacterium]
MERKLRVALLFGGRSAEHDVSLMSAANVFRALDQARYEVVPIAVARGGAWMLCPLIDGCFPAEVPADGPLVTLLPGGGGRLVVASSDPAVAAPAPVDVIFPVLHGPFGEDGSVQGLAELSGVPFVGASVFASAAAMDKDAAKRLLRDAGLPIARFRALAPGDTPTFAELVAELGRPLFVKPARLGSSVGVGKADSAEEFDAALREAFRHDRKVLVEECMRGREVECGVLEDADGTLTTSLPGEIVPTNRYAFYTYEAKYLDEHGAVLKVPADLPKAVVSKVQDLSLRAFRALGCEAMARVDFFLLPDMRVVVNEVNTIPGFTNISMYPLAFKASGVPYPELVDRLIQHALARAGRGSSSPA